MCTETNDMWGLRAQFPQVHGRECHVEAIMSSVCQRLELRTTASHILPSFSGLRKDGCPRISFSGTSCRQGLGAARVRSWRSPRVVYAELGFKESDSDATLVFNQTAPPVGTVFPNTTSEVKSGNVLEEGAAFVRGKLEKKVAKFNQVLESVEDFVGPTPFAPTEGAGAVFFIFISVFFLFVFWIGNYVVPAWIFRATVFNNSREGKQSRLLYDEDDDPDSTRTEEGEEVDPADLIELPPNLMAFREAAVSGFKAGRQKARDQADPKKKKAKRRK